MKKKYSPAGLIVILLVIVLSTWTIFNGLNLGIAKIPNVKDGVVLGLDLVGGAEITYEADLEGADVSAEELSEGMKAAQTMLRERLTTFGYTEADVYLSGDDRVVVAIPNIDDPEEAVQMLGSTAKVTFVDADGNVKIGYVGAYNYAEVVSGYTAFFLGVQSVYPDVEMEVMYTNSWFDIDKEGAAAEALIANGAVIIGQHADSTGAPAATQKLKDSGKICYSVGYNIDMLATAPTAALTSATNVWKVYYKELFEGAQAGSIPQDWCKGYEDGAVAITDLGPECADGTAEKVAEVEAALKDGSLHVFDTSKFTVGGETVTTAPVDLTYYDYSTGSPVAVYQGETKEAISDGYFHEGELRAAPTFSLRIDGIIEDADPVA